MIPLIVIISFLFIYSAIARAQSLLQQRVSKVSLMICSPLITRAVSVLCPCRSQPVFLLLLHHCLVLLCPSPPHFPPPSLSPPYAPLLLLLLLHILITFLSPSSPAGYFCSFLRLFLLLFQTVRKK